MNIKQIEKIFISVIKLRKPKTDDKILMYLLIPSINFSRERRIQIEVNDHHHKNAKYNLFPFLQFPLLALSKDGKKFPYWECEKS